MQLVELSHCTHHSNCVVILSSLIVQCLQGTYQRPSYLWVVEWSTFCFSGDGGFNKSPRNKYLSFWELGITLVCPLKFCLFVCLTSFSRNIWIFFCVLYNDMYRLLIFSKKYQSFEAVCYILSMIMVFIYVYVVSIIHAVQIIAFLIKRCTFYTCNQKLIIILGLGVDVCSCVAGLHVL